MEYCLAVFETTHETLRAEGFFKKAGVVFRPVLRPRGIGSACRMALRFGSDDLEKARLAVADGGLKLLDLYRFESERWVKL